MFNKKNGNLKKTVVLSIVIFGAVGITIWYNQYYIGEKHVSEFLFSVLTSIIASFGYAIITGALYGKQDMIDNLEEGVSQIKRDADRLEHIQNVMEEKISKGIIDVRRRDEYEEKFWIDFLRHTDGEMVLTGKTLYRWISTEKLKNDFKDCLIKLLSNKCKITLVIYQEDSLEKNSDKKEREEFRRFLYEQILPELTGANTRVKQDKREEMKEALSKIFIIQETKNLPYLYIYNGEKVIAMHYFKNRGNDSNLMFVMDAKNQTSRPYQDDFSKELNNMLQNSWINEYKIN